MLIGLVFNFTDMGYKFLDGITVDQVNAVFYFTFSTIYGIKVGFFPISNPKCVDRVTGELNLNLSVFCSEITLFSFTCGELYSPDYLFFDPVDNKFWVLHNIYQVYFYVSTKHTSLPYESFFPPYVYLLQQQVSIGILK